MNIFSCQNTNINLTWSHTREKLWLRFTLKAFDTEINLQPSTSQQIRHLQQACHHHKNELQTSNNVLKRLVESTCDILITITYKTSGGPIANYAAHFLAPQLCTTNWQALAQNASLRTITGCHVHQRTHQNDGRAICSEMLPPNT